MATTAIAIAPNGHAHGTRHAERPLRALSRGRVLELVVVLVVVVIVEVGVVVLFTARRTRVLELS